MRRNSVKNRNKQQRRRLIRCEALEERRLLAPVLVTELEPNNFAVESQTLNLGTADGKNPEITVAGNFDIETASNGFLLSTPDNFNFTLRAGDVFSARITVPGNGTVLPDLDFSLGFIDPTRPGATPVEFRGATTFDNIASGINITPVTRLDSPVLTGGALYVNYVIPQDGDYNFRLGTSGLIDPSTPAFGTYELEFQTLRNPIESEPVGTHQIVFLDFDGELVERSDFFHEGSATPQFGTVRFDSLSRTLETLGFTVGDEEDRLIDGVLAKLADDFGDISNLGSNGDFATTGIPGQHQIEFRNSRDHADPWGLPHVTRVIMTGLAADLGLPAGVVGVASSIDYGNLITAETNFTFAEDALAFPPVTSASVAPIDALAFGLGYITSHELGHSFGLRHTDLATSVVNIMDPVINYGEGPDGIFGTADDLDIGFGRDIYTPGELDTIGIQDGIQTLAYALPTGTVGASVTGRVFNDFNSDGNGATDSGIAGVTVFTDLNSNGLLDAGEGSTTTAADGSYQLTAAPGTLNIVALTPDGFSATTSTSVSVTSTTGSVAGPDFGFRQVDFDATGFKWNDVNGNGLREAGEPGIEGVRVYVDLDGDDRLDIFEPQATTAADGSYSINFPGAGNYVLREVVDPGFVQTFPVGGEHSVVFNGVRLTQNFDFGNQAARDFGDAPATFGVASHGFSANFGLGLVTDTEAANVPSANADGDDTNANGDDEDGITLLTPLAPGQTGQIQVTTRSGGTSGLLQGWIDLNNNGSFLDAGEQFIVNLPLGAGTTTLPLTIPTGTTEGNKFVRFRYGIEQNLGPAGESAIGEVEDYIFPVQTTQDLAQDDSFDVPRNSTTTVLNVLANDFVNTFDPIRIVRVDTSLDLDNDGNIDRVTAGSVIISADQQQILYTPANGFLGEDIFTYTVQTASGQLDTATVSLNVIFETAVPEALDDIFNVPENAANLTLDVIANDIPSPLGGLQIIGVGSTNNQGIVTISGGGQALQYTAAPGFTGTEQFTYTVRDASGGTSQATVTVELQPGSQLDDDVEFIIRTLDLNNQPIDAINVGDPTDPTDGLFRVQVLVDDIRTGISLFEEGLGSAYVDLLFSDSLVATVPSAGTLPFEITFGPLFPNLQTGDGSLPGLLNEIGGTQDLTNQQFHSGPVELFTVTMRAVGAGVATFQTDPLDAAFSDVVLLNNTNQEVPIERQRFGSTTLNIVPSGLPIPTAVDDVFRLSSATIENTLSVLDNDIEGVAGPVSIATVGTPANGFTRIDANTNTIIYTPQAAFQGVDQFSYTITSPDGFRSTAEVTVFVGNTTTDDIVDLPFSIVDAGGNAILDAAGNQIRPVTVGDELILQVDVDDLRPDTFGADTGVFAAYLDVLYSSGLVSVLPAAAGQTNSLGFDIDFGQFYTNSQVGDARTLGLINEVGAVQVTNTDGTGQPLGTQARDLLSIRFRADAAGVATFAGDPADITPFQDTLLFQPSQTVPIDQIRYDLKQVTITGGVTASGEFHNAENPGDVNGDGNVSPIDALMIINQINVNGGVVNLTPSRAEGEQRRIMPDVNNDGIVSPTDALRILNELNNRIQQGIIGGESPTTTANEAAEEADDVFAEFGSEAALAVTPTSSQNSEIDWSVLVESNDDDDEDDTVDQIALDVSLRRS